MLHQLVHVLCLFLVASITVCALDKTLFVWHPIFMSLGFLGLMAEGILLSISFRPTDGAKRTGKIQQHMYWQSAATLSVLAGLTVIVANKVRQLCWERAHAGPTQCSRSLARRSYTASHTL